jgi:DNA-binding FrmR family transcriptional regulator
MSSYLIDAQNLETESLISSTVTWRKQMAVLNDSEAKVALHNRLIRIEGQLRGVRRMIDEGEKCERIAQQARAARSALDGVLTQLAMRYLKQEADARMPQKDRRAFETVLADLQVLIDRAT